ncbi:MAG TPA: hypothetical protein VJ574_07625 [Candidatus Bathyarchaeia archaeon]|nr:hypothetical protein [Candidatus Bathyarchaeia archaeon]
MNLSIVGQFPWLKNVDVYNTTACDGDCEDCMAYDVRKEEGRKYVDTELYFSTMSSLEGIDSVHFAGVGEPFSHPDILEMLDYAGRRVKKEVRINTNGFFMLNNPSLGDFFRGLPINTHIFLSLDSFHERLHAEGTLVDGLRKLLEYSALCDIKVTLNIRTFDKIEEVARFTSKYSDGEVKPRFARYMGAIEKGVINRVLKVGRARNFEGSRPVDLTKLMHDHMDKPMIGFNHDGTVVSNFIIPYLPKMNRPGICVLGNLYEKPISEILRAYAGKYFGNRKLNRNSILRSMIDDMKMHPFVIENPNEYDWNDPALRDKKEEIIKNTLSTTGQDLSRQDCFFSKVVSLNGILHCDMTALTTEITRPL